MNKLIFIFLFFSFLFSLCYSQCWTHSTCGNCAQDINCVFCQTTNKCEPMDWYNCTRIDTGYCSGTQETEYCDDRNLKCQNCIDDYRCGWCARPRRLPAPTCMSSYSAEVNCFTYYTNYDTSSFSSFDICPVKKDDEFDISDVQIGGTTAAMGGMLVVILISSYYWYRRRSQKEQEEVKEEVTQVEPVSFGIDIPVCKDKDGKEKQCIAYIEFIQGFIEGRVVWFRNWKADLLFYHYNEHPLLSIFKGHHLHPIDNKERMVILLVLFLFSFWISSITSYSASADTCLDFCSGWNPSNYNETDPSTWSSGSEDTVDPRCYQECQDDNRYTGQLQSIGWGFLTWFVIEIMKRAATCACVQQEYGKDLSNYQRCFERMGHYFMGWVLFLCVAMAISGVAALGLQQNDFLLFGTSFTINFCIGFFKSFFTGTAIFFYYYYTQNKSIDDNQKWDDKFYIWMNIDDLEKLYKMQKAKGISEITQFNFQMIEQKAEKVIQEARRSVSANEGEAIEKNVSAPVNTINLQTPTQQNKPMMMQPGQPIPIKPGQPMPMPMSMQPGQPMPMPMSMQPGQPMPMPMSMQPGQPMPMQMQMQMQPGQPMPMQMQMQPGQPMPMQMQMQPGQPMPMQMPVSMQPGQPIPMPMQMQPGQPMPMPVSMQPGQPMPMPVSMQPGQPMPMPVSMQLGQPMPMQMPMQPGQPMQPMFVMKGQPMSMPVQPPK